MVKWQVVVIGVAIALFLFLIPLLLPMFGFQLEAFTSPTVYFLILLTAILIVISAFIPSTWRKLFQNGAYLTLFLLIILIELNIMKPYLKETNVSLETCRSGIFPTAAQLQTPSDYYYSGLKYTSCVFTGYFPAEQGDLGWTVFYIFYFILPFAFIWTFMYGLMTGMNFGAFFGGFTKSANTLLSFIIAVYAGRVMFGGFLLSFLGLGAWGLAAIFGAILLVGGLKHMFDSWYGLEDMGFDVKKAVENEAVAQQSVIPALKKRLDEIEKLPGPARSRELYDLFVGGNSTDYRTMTQFLDPGLRDQIKIMVEKGSVDPQTISQIKSILK